MQQAPKPLWKPPRIVVEGHISEIVTTDGLGKTIYGPDADDLVGTVRGNPDKP